MNLCNMETFLCVARNQNLSVAADTLFVSQSTVSTRIRQLEEELGVVLIRRGKGMRNVELTPQGAAFVPLAERWLVLNAETESFSSQRFVTPFCVACPDSLNTYLFQPLYRQLADPEYALSLRVRTHQSAEIFALIDSGEADAGFAFHLFRSSNVICKPLFREKMVLLCSNRGHWPTSPIRPEDLDPNFELFLSWSRDIQLWHDSWWGPAQRPYIHLDSAPMLLPYMDEPRCWALCPTSVANAFLQNGAPVEVHELTHTPPDRVCYYLTNRTPKNSTSTAARAFFQHKLHDHLARLQPLVQLEPNAVKLLDLNESKEKSTLD